MFLYATLALPWELLKSHKHLFISAENFLKNHLVTFEDTYKNKDKAKPMYLLWHLRNAVSHAKIELLDGKGVIFRDQDPKDSSKIFSAKLSLTDTEKLIDQLYAVHESYIIKLKMHEHPLGDTFTLTPTPIFNIKYSYPFRKQPQIICTIGQPQNLK